MIANQFSQYDVHQYWCCHSLFEWNEHHVLDQSIHYSQYTVKSYFSCWILWWWQLCYEVHSNWLSWSVQHINLCYFIILFISLNLVSSAWITLSDVFHDSISKIADIVFFVWDSQFIWLQDVHLCCCDILINSSFIKEAFFTLYVAAKSFVKFHCLHSEFQCELVSLLHDQIIYSKCLLHHSHYFSCNEFEIQNLLTTQFIKPVTDSASLLLWSFSDSYDQ
jgi:hypothetical protein